ncbi:MAG: EAL domain-containing protein [Gammaproteobacteria bacterium]|nr:EAL domain-containing protein [Gammaproteobacteria bacterium]
MSAILAGDPRVVITTVIIASGATIQALWSAHMLRLFGCWPGELDDGRSVAKLLIVAGPVGCVANATIGVGSLLATGLIKNGEFSFNWMNWWIGDAIGVVLLTPLVLIWFGAMGEFWRRRAIAITIPTVVALTVVISAFLISSSREQARIQNGFEERAQNVVEVVSNRINVLLSVLGGIQSFYESSDFVSADEFTEFTERALTENPDLRALSWNPVIKHHQREGFESGETTGFPIRFTEKNARNELVEATTNDEYVIVQYVEPLASNQSVVGFNVASHPARNEAIKRARDSGTPAVTSRLQLVQAEGLEPGVLIFAPIYRSNHVPGSRTDRNEAIGGYAVGVIAINPFLRQAINQLRLEHTHLQLHDISSGDTTLLASTAAEKTGETLLYAEYSLPVAGKVWQVRVSAGAEYLAEHRAPGMALVLAIGLLLCGLLGAFNLTLAGNERREAIRAAHDPLTGLVNRGEFERRLGNALQGCTTNNSVHALAYCDLDQFKLINDTAGHPAGDELLRQIGRLIGTELRSRDTVARLGGDEFGLLLENCPLDKASEIASRVCKAVRSLRFQWNGDNFQIGASIGVIAVDAETASIEDALARADMACYAAKDLGRNRVHIDSLDNPHIERRQSELQHISHLRNTLENGSLMIYKQPIRAINDLSGAPASYEVLLRLRGPDGKIQAPGPTIAVAERYGIMAEVDRWVIQQALEQAPGLCAEADSISINLSANSLDDESLAEFVREAIANSGIRADQVCFEITETAAISNLESALQFIDEMKALGCQFALDDFGAGISSFRYLKTFPVDWLKIDGNLVKDLANDQSAFAMVSAINQVGSTMGIATIAEWVSDTSILEKLREIGVDYVQGFALGMPSPVNTVPDEPVPA